MRQELELPGRRRPTNTTHSLKYRVGLVGCYVVGAAVLFAQLAFTLPVGGATAAHAGPVVEPSLSARGEALPTRDLALATPTAPPAAEAIVAETPTPENDAEPTPLAAQATAEPESTQPAAASTASSPTALPSPEDAALVLGVATTATPTDAEPALVDAMVSPTATAASEPTRRPAVATYTVAAGDTVAAIAERYGLSERTIRQANGLQPGASLLAGQQLLVLPVSGVLHTVVTGETVLSLAERYGVIPEDLVALNGLTDADLIVPGQRLIVPEVPEAERQPIVVPPTASPTAVPTATAAPRPSATPTAPPTLVPTATPTLVPSPTATLATSATAATHVVAAGDTPYAISRRYGISVAALLAANNLTATSTLDVGRKLTIPAAGAPTAATVAGALAIAASPTAVPTSTPRPSATPPPAPTSTPLPQPSPTSTKAPVVASQPGRGGQTVATAMGFLGYKYVWGGSTPQPGFDCSGFVYYVLRQNGVAIPRDLGSQLGYGVKVDRSALQPGDIVFFQNTYRPGLSHDGIYVGNGQFVHAATENVGVIVSRLDHPYWGARYVGAVRP